MGSSALPKQGVTIMNKPFEEDHRKVDDNVTKNDATGERPHALMSESNRKHVLSKSPDSDRSSEPSSKDESERQTRSSTSGTSLSGSNDASGDFKPQGESSDNTAKESIDKSNSESSPSDTTGKTTNSPQDTIKIQKEISGKDSRKGININGKKRYPCPFPGCDKTFSTSGHSSRHSRIHTGEKPYRCSYPGCNAQFSRYDNSLQHYRTHIISSKGGRKSRTKSGAQTAADAAEASEVDKQARAAITVAGNDPAPTPTYPNRPVTVENTTVHPTPVTTIANPVPPVATFPATPSPGLVASVPATGLDVPVVSGYVNGTPAPATTDMIPVEPVPVVSAGSHGPAVAAEFAPREANGLKKMRSHTTEATIGASVSPEAERLRCSSSSTQGPRPVYSGQIGYPPRLSMTKDSRTWHYLPDSTSMPTSSMPRFASSLADEEHKRPDMWPDFHAHKRLTSDPGTAYRIFDTRSSAPGLKPILSPQHPVTSPLSSAENARKPVLIGSHTFDFGSRPTAYPLSGTELDRVAPPEAHDWTDAEKGPPRKQARHGLEPLSMHSRPPPFRMRKSGSMPSMLTLEMPRSESSHSLSKYSLSSGMPATSAAYTPVPSQRTEVQLNPSPNVEQLTSIQHSESLNDRKEAQAQDLVLPPLSRLP